MGLRWVRRPLSVCPGPGTFARLPDGGQMADMDSCPTNPLNIDVSPRVQEGSLCVRLSGDVDVSGITALAAARPRIGGPGAATVFVDVGPVTFFGTTLLNFLVQLVNAAPGARLVVCRPSPFARRVLSAVPLPSQISVRSDLPPEWAEPASAGLVRARAAAHAAAG